MAFTGAIMTQISINQLMQSTLGQHGAGAAEEANLTDLVETRVYIGLNDAETKRQEFATEQYVSVLKRVCVAYGVPFSFDIIGGGYIHDNGEYTEERTIVLAFIDVADEVIGVIAKDLCSLFHQETVLVTSGPVKARVIRGEHP